MQTWPEHALLLVNSVANLLALIGAAIVLVAIVLLYFTGTELHKRGGEAGPVSGQDRSKALRQRVSQLQTNLKAAQRSEEAIALRVSRTEADLAAARRSDEAKQSRLNKLEADLAAAAKANEQKSARVAQLQSDLKGARATNEKNSARLGQLEAELDAERTASNQKSSRLTKLEAELATVRAINEKNNARLTQVEAELAAANAANEQKSSRLSQVEPELAAAKKTAEEAKALAKQLEKKEQPRTITPERRSQFLDAVKGLPKGKVIVSAIFFNNEAHELGSEIVNLLDEAGFDVLAPEPLNFFTTSRPPSGIRIGYKNPTDKPADAVTLEKGFTVMGWPPERTTLVNGKDSDVVEIQVTPRE